MTKESEIDFDGRVLVLIGVLALVLVCVWYAILFLFVDTSIKAEYQPLPTQYVGTHVDPLQIYLCKDGTTSEVRHRIGACYGNGGIVTD